MNTIKKETFYYLLLVVYIFNEVLSESQYINIPTMSLILAFVRYFVIVSLFILVLTQRKLKSGLICIFGILLLFVLLNLILADGGISYISIVLFAISSKNYSLKKIFKYTLYSIIGSHIVVMLSALFGILDNSIDFRYIGQFSGSVLSGAYYRHSMGFLVHNQIPIAFLIIYLYVIALRKNNITIKENIVFLLLNYLIFRYCGSRIVFILMIFAVGSYFVIKIHKKNHIKLFNGFFGLTYLVAALLSVISTCLYENNSLWNNINMIFNNRISMASEALQYYGIKLIGSGTTAVTYNSASLINITIDNGYINLLIRYGLIIFVIVLGLWMAITFIVEKNGNKYLLLVLCVLALENLINSHLDSFKFIPFFCILVNPNDHFLEQNYHVLV